MAKFRVVRGGPKPGGGNWGIGLTYEADTARAAVKKSNEEERKSAAQTFGGLVAPCHVAPVIAVYALTLVPKSEWE